MKMREIKFSYLWNYENHWMEGIFTLDQIEMGCQFDYMSDNPMLRKHKLVTRRQYTGLKDKNGKEIYEGDIIDLHSTVNGVNLFEIYYDESQARFSIKYHTKRMPKRDLKYEYSVSGFFKPCEFSGEVDYEVIGNIHENPKLLGEKR